VDFEWGIRGDEKGNRTYTGNREESVIDYVLVNDEVEKELAQLEIGDNIESSSTDNRAEGERR